MKLFALLAPLALISLSACSPQPVGYDQQGQPIYAQQDHSFINGMMGGMLGSMIFGGGGGYNRGPTIVNHTVIQRTVVRPSYGMRPTYRAPSYTYRPTYARPSYMGSRSSSFTSARSSSFSSSRSSFHSYHH